MLLIAAISLNPGGIIAWLLVGMISGWLAGLMMEGGGFGIVGDIVVGLIGAVLGGLVFSLLVEGDAGFWGSILVSFIGACILIGVLRAMAPGRRV